MSNYDVKCGYGCVIGERVTFGENVTLGHHCVIEDGAEIGSGTRIESNTLIRGNVILSANGYIGSNCVIGETMPGCEGERNRENSVLTIGERCLIRSGSILYLGSKIGTDFQTGHHVTIRERAEIGNHVSVGTLSDIQGDCRIGNYVRMHSNVHVGKFSVVDDFVWLFPYVVFTNDPTPPSEELKGVHIRSFAVIATGAIILPGVEIGQDALVAAGAVVTKSVGAYSTVAGNPARYISDVRQIKNRSTGDNVYPWRDHFKRHMPWENSDFSSWYAALTISDKEHYQLAELSDKDVRTGEGESTS